MGTVLDNMNEEFRQLTLELFELFFFNKVVQSNYHGEQILFSHHVLSAMLRDFQFLMECSIWYCLTYTKRKQSFTMRADITAARKHSDKLM